jgi:hypothetical protein
MLIASSKLTDDGEEWLATRRAGEVVSSSWRAASKSADRGRKRPQGVLRAVGMHRGHTFDEAGLAEFCLGFVFCLNAVCEDNKQLTRAEHDLILLVAARGHDAER